MTDTKREILIGYAIGALEEHEELLIQQELLRDPALRQELAAIRIEFEPLRALDIPFEPPIGLAERTAQFVWNAVDERSANVPPTLESFDVLAPIGGPEILANTPASYAYVQNTPKKKLFTKKTWKTPDVIASIVVGVLIAVVAFPAIVQIRDRATSVIGHSQLRNMEQQVSVFAPESVLAPDSKARLNDPRGIFTPVNLAAESRLERPVLDLPPESVSDVFELERYFGSANFTHPNLTERSNILFIGEQKNGSNVPSLRMGYGNNVIFRDGNAYFRMIPANTKRSVEEK